VSFCEFEVSKSGEVRVKVRAEGVILGIGVMKSVGFSRKIAKTGLTGRIGGRKMKLLEVPLWEPLKIDSLRPLHNLCAPCG